MNEEPVILSEAKDLLFPREQDKQILRSLRSLIYESAPPVKG